jgi:hypothetical protein
VRCPIALAVLPVWLAACSSSTGAGHSGQGGAGGSATGAPSGGDGTGGGAGTSASTGGQSGYAGAQAGAGGQSGGGGSGGAADPLDCANTHLQATVDSGGADQTLVISCGATIDLCCAGGVVVNPCPRVHFDFVAQTGEPPALMFTPADQNHESVTLRARLRTTAPIPVVASGSACTLAIDTSPGPTPYAQFTFEMDGREVTDTSVTILPIEIADLTADDFTIGGDPSCAANLPLDQLTNIVYTVVWNFLQGPICNSCPCIEV